MGVLDPRQSLIYFKKRYNVGKPSEQGWYSFDCPLCGGEKKRAVHLRMEITKCWTCSYRDSILHFIMLVDDCEYKQAKAMIEDAEISGINLDLLEHVENNEEVVHTEVKLPKGFKPIHRGKTQLAIRARKALRARGFNIKKLARKGFGYCNRHYSNDPDKNKENNNKDFFGYLIIPFKRDGLLVYYQGRDFINNWLRYKNPPLDYVGIGKSEVIYNEEALYLYDEVAIIEGWADAETWGEEGTATQGWSLSNYQRQAYLKCTAKVLVFIPDAGANKEEGGELFYHMAVRTAREFLDSGKEIYVVNLNRPHLTKYGKDINEIGRERVYKERMKTPRLTWSNVNRILSGEL